MGRHRKEKVKQYCARKYCCILAYKIPLSKAVYIDPMVMWLKVTTLTHTCTCTNIFVELDKLKCHGFKDHSYEHNIALAITH